MPMELVIGSAEQAAEAKQTMRKCFMIFNGSQRFSEPWRQVGHVQVLEVMVFRMRIGCSATNFSGILSVIVWFFISLLTRGLAVMSQRCDEL